MVSACGIFSFTIWKKDKTEEQTALHFLASAIWVTTFFIFALLWSPLSGVCFY
jgi:hypothetical protein